MVRSIGLVRARARIGLNNLAYNMRRLVQLERLAAAAPTGWSSGEESAWSPPLRGKQTRRGRQPRS